ncbi:MAG TPA: SDR family oxidoreductase [Candidatus Dormibacteraeota bacterium]|nr:SDR family oxidoreductase [Candidatus Dormibacteraeota bacterium]
MEVDGRVVVVTGAARGIGRALARGFARAGAAGVVVADIDGRGADTVAREINGMAVTCDVADESSVRAMVARADSTYGRIDIVCSNAGIAVSGGPETANNDWQRIWEVNVMSHVLLARHVLPEMVARRDGYLVGTISAAGLLNHVFAAPYGATKAAALSFFEWLAIAHGEDGIRVSCLCPQGVRTDMLAAESRLGLEFLTANAVEPEHVADVVLEGIRQEKFLILPHPEVAEYFQRKATDYDRWLNGMRRMRKRVLAASS